jgi:hypothetical protein
VKLKLLMKSLLAVEISVPVWVPEGLHHCLKNLATGM